MKTLEQLIGELPLERQAKVKALSEQLIQEVRWKIKPYRTNAYGR